MLKQRNESVEMYQKANRQDLVDKEKNEIEIIKEFLPQQLSTTVKQLQALSKLLYSIIFIALLSFLFSVYTMSPCST